MKGRFAHCGDEKHLVVRAAEKLMASESGDSPATVELSLLRNRSK
jgi:hypothetical protein